jgi:PHP family Zn ribbon phosphoesterase
MEEESGKRLKDAFEKILKGNLSYDRCLNLAGRKEKHPYHPPEYLKEITEDILNKGLTLSESCKEKQIKTGKNYKTLMQHFGEYSETLLYGWFFFQEMNGKRITYEQLKSYQKKAIQKYFHNQVHENYK